MNRSTIDHVLVVVPALDEAATVAGTVTSIRRALGSLPGTVTSDVVVAVDRLSADDTARVARRAIDTAGVVLDGAFGSVGEARRQATALGLRRAPGELDQIWIATTDADTTVPTSWLTSQVGLVQAGIVAVAGIVELHEPSLALADSFREHYILHADGTHPHVHGANLGIRADAYVAAGGWRDRATGEDHDLWDRLRSVGPVIHSTAVSVTTSARARGRAPLGFAADLAALAPIA